MDDAPHRGRMIVSGNFVSGVGPGVAGIQVNAGANIDYIISDNVGSGIAGAAVDVSFLRTIDSLQRGPMSEEDDVARGGKLVMKGNRVYGVGPGGHGFVVQGLKPGTAVEVSENQAFNVHGGVGFGLYYEAPHEIKAAILATPVERQAVIVDLINKAKEEPKGSESLLNYYKEIVGFAADNFGFWGPVLPILSSWILGG